jgi:hypothetical protein
LLYNDSTSNSGAADTGSGFTAGSPVSGWDFGSTGNPNAYTEHKRYTSTSALAATYVSINNLDATAVGAVLYKEASSGIVDEDPEWIQFIQLA